MTFRATKRQRGRTCHINTFPETIGNNALLMRGSDALSFGYQV